MRTGGRLWRPIPIYLLYTPRLLAEFRLGLNERETSASHRKQYCENDWRRCLESFMVPIDVQATSSGRPRSDDKSAGGFFNSGYYTRTGAYAGTTRSQRYQERTGQYHWGSESSRYGADTGLEGFWRRLFDTFGLSSSEPEVSPLQPPRFAGASIPGCAVRGGITFHGTSSLPCFLGLKVDGA